MKYDKKYEIMLSMLESAGYQAYIVGGCVRDMLLGRPVSDIDITTNALPEQIMEVFSGMKVIPTGIKHGTVTVLYDSEPFEITTFRVDGSYSDSRRPDSVKFSSSLEEDLARRDLTINAMAMDIRGKVHDPFCGEADLKAGILRCVGEPEKRFAEDALRILRTVRFASVLGYRTDEKTETAALAMRSRLDLISRERCRDELIKMIMGSHFAETALRYREIIAQLIPEFRPCFDFQQRSKYHKYDVYEHIVRAVEAAPENELLRTAMLLHDIGKPQMFKLDENGVGHFKGHAGVSADIAREVMKRLRFSSDFTESVCTIIAYHSDTIGSEKHIKRMISRIGAENLFLLLEAKKADNLAKCEFVLDENPYFDKCAEIARELIRQDQCMSLRQLAVNGNDMKELGLCGKAIGAALEALLALVIDEELPNEKDRLIAYTKEELL